jgi:pepF/M3 family oligoendopeptidase
MTTVYPSLDSARFAEDFHSVIDGISDLATLFDEYRVEKSQDLPVNDATVDAFETVIAAFSSLIERLRTLQSYIFCFVATDSRDTVAQARMSELQQHLVLLSQLETRLTAWIGSLDVEALVERSSVAREHAFMVRKAKEEAAHLMLPAEEALAAELEVTGGTAWTKLHHDVTSQLLVPMEMDGQVQEIPMSVVRNLASDPDRDVRRRAYEAELDTWRKVAVPIAAALNSIKGETNTLETKRGWDSPLDAALFHNNLDQQTLDAMMAAARASFSDFRRYLRAKARALGVPALAWYDLFAPLGDSDQEWEFDEAADFLLTQFGAYSSRLRSFAERAFRERWIDAEPRPGKQGGAFCLPLRDDESRVLSNFQANYDGMSTLAHELGHAYHNFNLARRPALQRTSPMPLAETASIFCETVVREAALERAEQQQQIAILEASIQNACQVVVDITSRFLFEERVLESRQRRELSVDELNELMLDSQRETYGDGLDRSLLHPFMWAVKEHYYSAPRPYYNSPYMFGLLFGLGLYAEYRRDPEEFQARYDELLSSTGMADAATLAGRFGIDIRKSSFWEGSLGIIRTDIDRLESLLSGS